jgi:hypothetical protein
VVEEERFMNRDQVLHQEDQEEEEADTMMDSLILVLELAELLDKVILEEMEQREVDHQLEVEVEEKHQEVEVDQRGALVDQVDQV